MTSTIRHSEENKVGIEFLNGKGSLSGTTVRPVIHAGACGGKQQVIGRRRSDMPRLPSLTGMRAFDTVARLGSITKAAEVLCVTPSAVKHRIGELEDELGVKLFERQGNRLQLTAAGASGFKEIADAFSRISNAFEVIRACATNDREIRIVAPGSIIAEWLMPRFEMIEKAAADHTILLEACDYPTEDSSFRPDIMIVDGDKPPDARNWIMLLQEEIFPVASPEYVEAHGCQTAAQMASCDLIELVWPESLVGHTATWQNWFSRTSHPAGPIDPKIKVTHAALALQLAERGQGIALVGWHTAGRALQERRVVRVADTSIPGIAWWILNLASGEKRETVSRIIDKLILSVQTRA